MTDKTEKQNSSPAASSGAAPLPPGEKAAPQAKMLTISEDELLALIKKEVGESTNEIFTGIQKYLDQKIEEVRKSVIEFITDPEFLKEHLSDFKDTVAGLTKKLKSWLT